MRILESIKVNRRTLGILLDPEKLDVDGFPAFAKAIQSSTLKLKKDLDLDQIIFLIGGSTMENVVLDSWLIAFKNQIDLKLVLFPGSAYQISEHADGLLFLNLISGRNPEYLIGEQVKAASRLKESKLDIIPTGYVLLNGGKQTAVERVSKTKPIDQKETDLIMDTVFAGQLMGNQLIYLEAGSGANVPVNPDIVGQVVSTVDIPVIVGGGLRTLKDINERFKAGAKLVVVGTAIEDDLNWKG
ncbi:putative glycerol-1-phosphate prenyltransferase [Nonlabens sp. Hel1_33_55]|uniref:geranylgeranylglyceryl/heptaprenylglyceryl phosphate synthase n=1 Tax=Nonlabens sp. Hel1_33_55 TaxID=1336802 RepID=UPI000875E284|nr:geranylgeranylglyceryl/heptaprenylglyceryl phosphate synthase [Nonlabens sp. Hel1_33_55]SCY36235.1 putative glycerol-1-phosphate prenyltransferase [Nonlabens sp. Hel1_33_55]